jgi:hypothetical protein
MKPSSAKQKGRLFQQTIVRMLIKAFDLEADDVFSRSMGASGEDVMLSPKARVLFPYSVECKNTETFNMWQAYKQASDNAGGYEPIVFVKRNRHKPLVVVDAEHFTGVISEQNDI